MEATNELAVTVQTDSGELTMTPLSLLRFYLPDAKPLPNNPQCFEGIIRTQGSPDRKVYVQVEALYGLLQESKEKHLNPVTEMHLMPSNSPDKRATHKVKYTVGIERARLIPGFLGLNFGLLVLRDGQLRETHGAFCLRGDEIEGAWAEAYVSGLAKPVRHEVGWGEFAQSNYQWDKRGPFMICKVVVDQLCHLKLSSMFARAGATLTALPPASDADEVILEGHPDLPPDPGKPEVPQASASEPEPEDVPFEFLPQTPYVGTITALVPRAGKATGRVIVKTEHGELLLYFWSRPDILKAADNWTPFVGAPCSVTFTEKPDKSGRSWRYVADLDIVPGAAA